MYMKLSLLLVKYCNSVQPYSTLFLIGDILLSHAHCDTAEFQIDIFLAVLALILVRHSYFITPYDKQRASFKLLLMTKGTDASFKPFLELY